MRCGRITPGERGVLSARASSTGYPVPRNRYRCLGRRVRVLLCTLLLIVFGIDVPVVFAIGSTTMRRAEDFVVTIDSTWAGGGSGGYYPIRVRIQNRGPDRSLTIRFVPIDEPAPLVRRTVEVPQNAAVTVTLSIPCVSPATYGRLEVLQQGRVMTDFTETVGLPDLNDNEWPSLLVISPDDVDRRGFEDGASGVYVQGISFGGSAGGFGGSFGGGGGGGWADSQVVEPSLLPQTWVDYTAVDLVAVSMPTFAALSEEQRSAILDWVVCGGTLIIHDVGKRPPDSPELPDLIHVSEYAAESNGWNAPEARRRKDLENGSDPFVSGERPRREGTNPQAAKWPDGTVFRRSLALGRIYAIQGSAFPGSPADWQWIVDDLGPTRSRWIMREGMSARQANSEFLEFLIPSVRGVPVGVILVLITVFAVVIGPLNYLYLWRKSRLYLLVLTIPAIALGTSIALFAYSAFAHGFGVRSRVRSLTVLDQRAKTSVTSARVALYAGLAPSDGLRFSPETAVFPVWSPTGGGFKQATVDWTEQQHFASGWLESRTRTQFLLCSLRDQRGRLEITGDEHAPQAANGLEWNVSAVVVSTHDGRLWYAHDLAAGETASLASLTTAHRGEFARLLSRNAPELPERLTRSGSSPFSPLSAYNVDIAHQFQYGMLEKNLAWLGQIRSAGFTMPPDSYAAILADDPGVDVGLEQTAEEASVHVLVGYY